jgi:hypothetical protein
MITNLHTYNRDGLGKIRYMYNIEGMSKTTGWLEIVLIEHIKRKLLRKPLFNGISMRYINGEEL